MLKPVYDILNCGPRHRFGANGKLVHNSNWQNFRRGGEIRKSIMAPEGHSLVIGDLSQIEYRLLCWVAGQTDKLDALATGRDLYSELATDFYNYPVDKKLPQERGLGKQITLSCGYGSGAGSIQATAASGGYGPPVILDDREALRARDLYRRTHPHVVQFWKWCEHALQVLHAGTATVYRDGLLTVSGGRIALPNGTHLDYTGLRWAGNHEIFPDQEPDGDGPCWWEPSRRGWSRLWGSKLCAEITQALACVVIKQAMVQMGRAGHRCILQIHDELVFFAPDAEADLRLVLLLAVLKTPPVWAPDIPLDAEGIVSKNYSK